MKINYGLLQTKISTLLSSTMGLSPCWASIPIADKAFCIGTAKRISGPFSLMDISIPVGTPLGVNDPKLFSTSYPDALSISDICCAYFSASMFEATLPTITFPFGAFTNEAIKLWRWAGVIKRPSSETIFASSASDPICAKIAPIPKIRGKTHNRILLRWSQYFFRPLDCFIFSDVSPWSSNASINVRTNAAQIRGHAKCERKS